MVKTDLILSLDAELVTRIQSMGANNLVEVIEAALRRHLDRAIEDQAAGQRWAEDNAITLEALAGGAEEAKAWGSS